MGYLEAALQALQSSNVYVAPGANADAIAISEDIGLSNTAVVILPAGASKEVSSLSDFVSAIGNQTSYDTVMVAMGGDFEAGATADSGLEPGEASSLANQLDGSSDITAATQEFIAEVQHRAPAGDSGIPTPVIGGGILIAVAAALAFFAYKRRQQKQRKQRPDVTMHQLLDEIDGLRSHVKHSDVSYGLSQCTESVRSLLSSRMYGQDAAAKAAVQRKYEGGLAALRDGLKAYLYVQNEPESDSSVQKVLEYVPDTAARIAQAAKIDLTKSKEESYDQFALGLKGLNLAEFPPVLPGIDGKDGT